MRLNHAHVIPGGGCVCGVVGACLSSPLAGWGVRKHHASRSVLGRTAVDGDSPVGESVVSPLCVSQVAASSWNSL
jgi:hypothetical protein